MHKNFIDGFVKQAKEGLKKDLAIGAGTGALLGTGIAAKGYHGLYKDMHLANINRKGADLKNATEGTNKVFKQLLSDTGPSFAARALIVGSLLGLGGGAIYNKFKKDKEPEYDFSQFDNKQA